MNVFRQFPKSLTLAMRFVGVRLVSVHCSVFVCLCPTFVVPSPRVDSAGKPACEDCGRRLSSCPGKPVNFAAGQICNKCYDKRRSKLKGSSTSCPSPRSVCDDAAPLPKKQRRTASDPGSHTNTGTTTAKATPKATASAHAQGRILRSSPLLAHHHIHHPNGMCLPCCCYCLHDRSVS